MFIINYPSIFLTLKRILNKAEIDRAVFFGVLTKIWSIVSWPVTALFILINFTPEVQGYYYAFANLLSLRIFVEFGLGVVIIQFASHEWAGLSLDEHGHIKGDNNALSRLISLGRFSLRWFAIASIILIFVLGIGGYIFFSKTSNSPAIKWILPWLALCLFTGISTFMTPFWSLLEGCGQISNLYANRFKQSVYSTIAIWAAIMLGAKLWTPPISSVIILIVAGIFLRSKYWNFFKTVFFHRPEGRIIEWRKDILPLQWRIAVSWVSGYFSFFFFTPVLFYYHGSKIAGQMGMTWSFVWGLVMISLTWLSPKFPRFGMLIAQKKYTELDILFWRMAKIVIGIDIAMAIAMWLAVFTLNKINHPFAARFIPILPVSILLLAQVFHAISIPFESYLHAHKKEPLLFTSILGGIIMGLSSLILGKYFSIMGIAVGYLLTYVILTPLIIIIWRRCRFEWHKDGGLAT